MDVGKKIMAIDYGDVRTGIAVSDESAALVGPAWVIREKSRVATALKIAEEAVARGVGLIVVGFPKNMDGTVGPRAEKSEAFAQHLQSICGLEIILWDERMTTVLANRILADSGRFGKKRKDAVDAVAASLILESYLQSKKDT